MNATKACRYIDLARSIAENINRPHRHVSLVFHRNQIIAIGDNHRKTSPLNQKFKYRFDDSAHAEVSAFHRCRHLLRKGVALTLVNYHFNRYGRLKLGKPCRCCRKWIGSIFDRTFYSIPGGIEELK